MPKHDETKRLPYTPVQMYDLVADVARYPEFLPWCAAARIRSREECGKSEVMEAELVISFKVFRERFGSRVVLWPADRRIETTYLDGPFRHMVSHWHFHEASGGCRAEFFVDFEMKSALLQRVVGVVFNEAMHRIVTAFESRAKELYG